MQLQRIPNNALKIDLRIVKHIHSLKYTHRRYLLLLLLLLSLNYISWTFHYTSVGCRVCALVFFLHFVWKLPEIVCLLKLHHDIRATTDSTRTRVCSFRIISPFLLSFTTPSAHAYVYINKYSSLKMHFLSKKNQTNKHKWLQNEPTIVPTNFNFVEKTFDVCRSNENSWSHTKINIVPPCRQIHRRRWVNRISIWSLSFNIRLFTRKTNTIRVIKQITWLHFVFALRKTLIFRCVPQNLSQNHSNNIVWQGWTQPYCKQQSLLPSLPHFKHFSYHLIAVHVQSRQLRIKL